MSNTRLVVIGGVSVGLWWLFFTCRGREVLNRALRALGRPEVKPCCTGCADHDAAASVAAVPSSGVAAAPPGADGGSAGFGVPEGLAWYNADRQSESYAPPSLGIPGTSAGAFGGSYAPPSNVNIQLAAQSPVGSPAPYVAPAETSSMFADKEASALCTDCGQTEKPPEPLGYAIDTRRLVNEPATGTGWAPWADPNPETKPPSFL